MTPRFTNYAFLLFLALFLPFVIVAQVVAPKYAKVKISLENHSLEDIAALGLVLEPDAYVPNEYVTDIYAEQELDMLKQAQIPYTVLIEDMTAHFLAQAKVTAPIANSISNEATKFSNDYPIPINYPTGSMNGYLTYQELLATLDKMKLLYPNLISTKAAIGAYETAEGRPIYQLRISDNPEIKEAEPAVLYTALTHAREPISMHQMVFFMWYILENYETDEEIKNLVDNTELYFVPCVNPDGYIYNQNTYPSGGGYWRKNRWRDQTGRAFGVDLNRNFGYEWGLDSGSSNDPNRGTFRGLAAFSEPETSALRELCNSHQFQIALNYHSSGNLILFPWGHNRMPTADAQTFQVLGEIMTRENKYAIGSTSDVISYGASGISDDWMYGEQTEKNKIFAMTPELGDSFWVSYESLIRINKENVWQNLATAHLAHKYFILEEKDSKDLSAGVGTIDVSLFQAGLKEGLADIRVEALTAGVLITSPQLSINSQNLDTIDFSFDFYIPDSLEEEVVAFEIIMDNGLFAQRQIIERSVLIETKNPDSMATPPIPKVTETLLLDAFETAEHWYLSGDWGLCNTTYVSAGNSLCDSPNGPYINNTSASITIKQPLLLSGIEEAYLRFQAQWNLEENVDYVEISAAQAGYPFSVLKTYTGSQRNWTIEEFNLMDYVGDYVYIRFQIFTNGATSADGFYLDDLSVEVIRKEVRSQTEK